MNGIPHGLKVGYCFTGSFCTFAKSIEAMKRLKELGCDILPIMSYNAAGTDTRFGTAESFIRKTEEICGKKVITSTVEAEPIGPKDMTDIMVVCPCTGNTLAKLALSVTDTPVTMAVKSHLRGEKPVLIACSTNDALAGTLKNIAALMNYKHYYFVPFRQDDYIKKPSSLVADFSQLENAIASALCDKQVQPVIVG